MGHTSQSDRLSEKVEVVKKSFVNLARNLSLTRDTHQWTSVPFEEFLKKDDIAKAVSLGV